MTAERLQGRLRQLGAQVQSQETLDVRRGLGRGGQVDAIAFAEHAQAAVAHDVTFRELGQGGLDRLLGHPQNLRQTADRDRRGRNEQQALYQRGQLGRRGPLGWRRWRFAGRGGSPRARRREIFYGLRQLSLGDRQVSCLFLIGCVFDAHLDFA